jgi:prevent-host-death family protein
MEKTTASHFKAKLGHYMRIVRGGEEVVVTDRERPIARLIPYDEASRGPAIRVVQRPSPGTPPLGEVQVRAVRPAAETDSTGVLRDDRDRR